MKVAFFRSFFRAVIGGGGNAIWIKAAPLAISCSHECCAMCISHSALWYNQIRSRQIQREREREVEIHVKRVKSIRLKIIQYSRARFTFRVTAKLRYRVVNYRFVILSTGGLMLIEVAGENGQSATEAIFIFRNSLSTANIAGWENKIQQDLVSR